jgi:hypothetical protein
MFLTNLALVGLEAIPQKGRLELLQEHLGRDFPRNESSSLTISKRSGC